MQFTKYTTKSSIDLVYFCNVTNAKFNLKIIVYAFE